MSGKWIKWEGGKMPVPRGTLVEVKHRNKEIHIDYAGVEDSYAEDWAHDHCDGDIVAYRVVTPAERKRAKPPAPKRERRKAEPKKHKVSVPEHKERGELVYNKESGKVEIVSPTRQTPMLGRCPIDPDALDRFSLTEAGEQALNGFPWYIWTLAISGWLAFGVAVWIR